MVTIVVIKLQAIGRLWGETYNEEIVSSNPGNWYWMDYFSHLLLKILLFE